MVHPKITRHHFAKLTLGLCVAATTLMVGFSFGGRISEPFQRMMGGASKAKGATPKPQPTVATTASRPAISTFPSAVGKKLATVDKAVADTSQKSTPHSSDFSQGVNGHRSGGAVASSTQQVLSIATRRLPIAVVGQSYSATLIAENSSGLDAWTAHGLPTGLSLNAQTGVISGAILQAATGMIEIEVSVTDELEVASTRLALTILGGANIAATQAALSDGAEIEKLRREISTPEASLSNEALTNESGYQPASVATTLYPPPLFSLMGIAPSSSSPVFSSSSIVTSGGSYGGAGIIIPGQEVSFSSSISTGTTASIFTTMGVYVPDVAEVTDETVVIDEPESTTESGD